jgi:beta-glucosidase
MPNSARSFKKKPKRIKLKKHKIYDFPKGFLWGSAASSYQVEGGITGCDWYEWEPGRIANGDRAGRACGHYGLYEKDFALARSLGHNAHRLSLEWSRIEPEEGKWDEGAMDHYAAVLKSLRDRGLAPMVTLDHFTLPLWLAPFGYWASEKTSHFFARFAKKAAERLLPLAEFWITLNEPVLVVYMGYRQDHWPPGRSDWKDAKKALYHMILAHARAYHVLHEEGGKQAVPVRVGIAKHMRAFDPCHFSNPLDLMICYMRSHFLNKLFLEVIRTGILLPPLGLYKRIPWVKGTQDFIGLNYYTRDHVAFDFNHPSDLFGKDIVKKKIPRTAMGWQIYPRGLFRMLKYLKRFKLPVYITENGIATDRDEERSRFIRDHLAEVGRAMKEGVDVRGYFYWSLMDNFEWLDGFKPRFGLLEVNYETLERTIRPSAQVYRSICETNRLDAG